MINFLRKLFGLCVHEFAIINSQEIYTDCNDGVCYTATSPFYMIITEQCTHCDDVRDRKSPLMEKHCGKIKKVLV